MTNHWIDLKNSDCILIMGSNAAENHPISFKWVTRAQEAGAKMIHVDPRYTRTSTFRRPMGRGSSSISTMLPRRTVHMSTGESY